MKNPRKKPPRFDDPVIRKSYRKDRAPVWIDIKQFPLRINSVYYDDKITCLLYGFEPGPVCAWHWLLSQYRQRKGGII